MIKIKHLLKRFIRLSFNINKEEEFEISWITYAASLRLQLWSVRLTLSHFFIRVTLKNGKMFTFNLGGYSRVLKYKMGTTFNIKDVSFK